MPVKQELASLIMDSKVAKSDRVFLPGDGISMTLVLGGIMTETTLPIAIGAFCFISRLAARRTLQESRKQG